MRITKEEALRLAFALDVAITSIEWKGDSSVARPEVLKPRATDEALIHLREIRSHALRVNRDAAPEVQATVVG
jgi:hypothetical protein